MADSESVKKMLRAVLQSSKNGVAITSLQAEYRALCGETIPVKKLGFNHLEDYLRSIPTVVRLESSLGSLVCFAAVCKETAHIAELVARQKSSKKAGRSQVVNCTMRCKPSNPYALNVKPKTSLRQPSNWRNRTTNRRPAHGYGGFSASGEVSQLTSQRSPFKTSQKTPPPTQQPTRPNYVLDSKGKNSEVNKRLPDELSPNQVQAKTPVQVNKHPTEFNLTLEQNRLCEVLSVYSSGLWMSKLEAVYKKIFNQQPHPQTLLELEKWTHICSLEKSSLTNRTDRLIYPPLSTKPPTTYGNLNGPSVSPSSPVSIPLYSLPSTPEKLPDNASVPKPRGVPRNPLAKPSFVFPPEAMIDGLPLCSSTHNPELAPQFRNENSGDGPRSPVTIAREISLSRPSMAPLVQSDSNIVSVTEAAFLNTKSDSILQRPLTEDVRQKVKELLLKHRSGLWVQVLPKLFETTFKIPLPDHAFDDLSQWMDICCVEYPVPNDKRKAILYYKCRDELETTDERAHLFPSGLQVVGSPMPPRLNIPSDQYPSVLVTDAKSSNAVTIRYVGKNYSNAQETMEEAMRHFYNEGLYTLSEVTIGQLVAVKEEEDVVRAQVLEVISLQKIKVYYLDYGFSFESNAKNIRKLHQQFLSLPFQAINVKLAGLEHFSCHPSVLCSLEKMAVGKILLMETLEPYQNNDVPLVVLYDTSQEEDININLCFLQALRDETMNNPLSINVTYQDVCVTNVCANGIIYCQLPSRGMARICKLLEETEAFFKTQVTSELLVSRPFSGKLCLACYKGKWSRVEIINIYGNRVLEILLIDYGLTVTVEVTELREIPPPFLKDLIIIPPQAVRCSLVGVKVPEEGWSPDAVKWMKELFQGPKAAKMKILKFGDQEGNRLVHMHLFIDTDSMEVEDSVNHQLVQSELWQNFVTKHISNSSTDKGLSALVERLTLENLAPFANISKTTKTGSEVITSKTDTLSMPPLFDLPQPGQNMDVFVPVACHPGLFVLQSWQDLHKLVVLMGEMAFYYNKLKTSSQMEITKGNIFAAKVDKNWHRVVVKGILSNGLISIYELDHGKYELIRRTAIQPLMKEFRELPFQAITAQLAGLPRLQCSEEASMVFRSHVECRALVAQVESVEEAPDVRGAPWERKITVYLVDTTKEDRDVWIHTIIADVDSEQLSSAA